MEVSIFLGGIFDVAGEFFFAGRRQTQQKKVRRLTAPDPIITNHSCNLMTVKKPSYFLL